MSEVLRTPTPERWLEQAKRIAAAREAGKIRFVQDGDRVRVEGDPAVIAHINAALTEIPE